MDHQAEVIAYQQLLEARRCAYERAHEGETPFDDVDQFDLLEQDVAKAETAVFCSWADRAPAPDGSWAALVSFDAARGGVIPRVIRENLRWMARWLDGKTA